MPTWSSLTGNCTSKVLLYNKWLKIWLKLLQKRIIPFFKKCLEKHRPQKLVWCILPSFSLSPHYSSSFFYINWNKQGFYIRVSLGRIWVLAIRIFIKKKTQNIKSTPQSSIRNVPTVKKKKKRDIIRFGPCWPVWLESKAYQKNNHHDSWKE